MKQTQSQTQTQVPRIDSETGKLHSCPQCGRDPKQRSSEKWEIVQYCSCGDWTRVMNYTKETPLETDGDNE